MDRLVYSRVQSLSSLSSREHKILRKLNAIQDKTDSAGKKEVEPVDWRISKKPPRKATSQSRAGTEQEGSLGTDNPRETTTTEPFRHESHKWETGLLEMWAKHAALPKWSRDRLGVTTSGKQCFSMLLPPPNVTGSLHMGHALDISIQDAVARFQRMKGRQVLWIPGCDHAGTATQVIAEKKLQLTAPTRGKLSEKERQAFVRGVEQWASRSADTINAQIKRLGASVSWPHHVYTFDEQYQVAVKEAFCKLYEHGLIFRKQGLVHWNPELGSTVSDAEIQMQKVCPNDKASQKVVKSQFAGHIFHIEYCLVNSPKRIVVPTTRPETMFADVALAVSPYDPRAAELIGCSALCPVSGRNLPIMAAEDVDQKFGTGIMKLTPAHSAADYHTALRLGFEESSFENVFTLDGKMGPFCRDLIGIDRFSARDAIVQKLAAEGRLKEARPYTHHVPCCSRTGHVLETMLIPQWYVDSATLTSRVTERVEAEKKTNPKLGRWWDQLAPYLIGGGKSKVTAGGKSWKQAGDSNWCISRQVLWGHRVPAYRVLVDTKCIGWVVSRNGELEALENAMRTFWEQPRHRMRVEQDVDVLDTWFASALYPLAALGWPNWDRDIPEGVGYPIDLLVTGADIAEVWVGRMLQLCVQLTGQVPFRDVHMHGMLLDLLGRKMSKSQGNAIDPMHLIEGTSKHKLNAQAEESSGNAVEQRYAREMSNRLLHSSESREQKSTGTETNSQETHIPSFGADALRLALLRYQNHAAASPGKRTCKSQEAIPANTKFDPQALKYAAKLCNKLCSLVMFMLSKYEYHPSLALSPSQVETHTSPTQVSLVDEWILCKLSRLENSVADYYDNMDFSRVIHATSIFTRGDFSVHYVRYVTRICASQTNPQLRSSGLTTCLHVLRTILIMLHPIIPFTTEHLFQTMRNYPATPEHPQAPPFRSICDCAFPIGGSHTAPDCYVVRYEQAPLASHQSSEAAKFSEQAVQATLDLVEEVFCSAKIPLAKAYDKPRFNFSVHLPVNCYPLMTYSQRILFSRELYYKTHTQCLVGLSDETDSATGTPTHFSLDKAGVSGWWRPLKPTDETARKLLRQGKC